MYRQPTAQLKSRIAQHIIRIKNNKRDELGEPNGGRVLRWFPLEEVINLVNRQVAARVFIDSFRDGRMI
jgi:hypothetical protein